MPSKSCFQKFSLKFFKNINVIIFNLTKFLLTFLQVNVSAARAIRRFSSFGVGQHLLGGGRIGSPSSSNLGRTPSKHLMVPSALQSCIITEDEEEEEEEENEESKTEKSRKSADSTIQSKGPAVTVTTTDEEKSRRSSGEYGEEIPEEYNTDTPDGLRNYLQQMINTGLLPGGLGSGPAVNVSDTYSDDEH